MASKNSKGHGTKRTREKQPKSKLGKRRNKALAKPRAEARQEALRDALAKGNK